MLFDVHAKKAHRESSGDLSLPKPRHEMKVTDQFHVPTALTTRKVLPLVH